MDTTSGKQTTKPRYGVFSNARFMVSLAWATTRSVLWLGILQAALAVAADALRLFMTPAVLRALETRGTLSGLLTVIALFALALMLVGAASAYVGQNVLFGRIGVRSGIVGRLQAKFALTSYPNTLDQAFLKKKETAAQASSGNDEATEAIWTTLVDLLKNAAGLVLYLLLLARLDPVILLATCATSLLGYLAGRRSADWRYRHRAEEADITRRMDYVGKQAQARDMAKDIRIFHMQDWLMALYERTLRLYEAHCARAETAALFAALLDVVMTFLRNGIAYAYLIALALRDGLSASQFLLYFAAVGGLTAWIGGVLNNLVKLRRQSLDLSAVREYLEAAEPFRFEDGLPLKPIPNHAYALELQRVTFRYPGAEKDALKDISLRIAAGERLAVVGLNGAGKTTLIKLLCGFYDPTVGEVLLDGADIRPYNRRDYYEHFSAVFQLFSLMAGSVAENVAQSPDAPDLERVRDCLLRANLLARVECLPDGLNTHLGKEVYEDGVELSGGETQRLMLARALYKDAPIVVLDEPTAALDPLAERDVYLRYNELTRGKTAVYISHRLASTRFCDRVILLREGVIAEEGTHDELMARGGEYARIFEIQSRYYREGGESHEEA